MTIYQDLEVYKRELKKHADLAAKYRKLIKKTEAEISDQEAAHVKKQDQGLE